MRALISTVKAFERERWAATDKALIERVNTDGTATPLAQLESEADANRRLASYGTGVRVRVVSAAEARRLMTPAAPYVRRRR